MSHDVDNDLRRLFAESAESIDTLPAGFDSEVITAGSRRRRNRRATLGTGAAVLALLAAAAVWQGPELVEHSTPPTSNSDKVPTFERPENWLSSLPRGANVAAAYVVGQTLHAGDSLVKVTGPTISKKSSIELRGKVSTGWLAEVETDDPAPGQTTRELGVVAPDGSFKKYSYQESDNLPVYEVSPDGRSFVSGQEVRDAATGEVTSKIPNGLVGGLWLDEGIVAFDMDATSEQDYAAWLWNPDNPTSLEKLRFPETKDSGAGALTPNGRVAINRGKCTDVVQYTTADHVDTAFCAGQTFALSDSGSTALVKGWKAVDTKSGATTQLPVPSFTDALVEYSPEDSTFFWEDDDDVVFDMAAADGSATFYVRCTVSEPRCELASDALKDFYPPERLSRLQ